MKDLLTEIIKPLLVKVIAYIDSHNYWTAYLIIVVFIVGCVGIGYIASWLLQRQKVNSEIEKLGLESKEKCITLLDKLQIKRSSYTDQTILIQLSVKLCVEAILNKNISDLKQNRDELIDLYFNDLCAKFVEYIEICEIFYDGDRSKTISFIIDEIIPFLETTRMFLDTVNNQNILALLQDDKVALKKFTINPVLRFAENNMRFYQIFLKYKYRQKIKTVAFEKTT